MRPHVSVEVPRCSAGGACVSFFAIGDTGWANEIEHSVVDSMIQKARLDPVRFVMMLGDNFYRSGVSSVRDEQWRTHIEQVFTTSELDVPLRPLLGNHDHNGNTQAQVEYAKINPRWRMESQYYAFTEVVSPECAVDFFVLDTTPIRSGDDVADSQIRWLEDKLAHSTAAWKIVAGHHPIVSGGNHGGDSRVRDAIEPLIQRFGVDLYMAGHDHDLQLLRLPDSSCLQLVSGAGCSTRPVSWIEPTLYAEAAPGFAWIQIGPADLWIQFVTVRSGPVFAHHVSKPAR